MSGANYLTDEDVRTLRAIARAERQRTSQGRFGEATEPPKASEVYLIQVPCGSEIPAISGTTPGTEDCCLFKLHKTGEPDSNEFKIDPVLLPDGQQATVLVHNVHSQPVPAEYYWEVRQQKYGRWLVENPIQTDSTGSSVVAATTTTLSDDPGETGCTGQCKWVWNDTDKEWDLDENSCDQDNSVTTTSTTPDPDCLCVKPTTSTTSTTTTTSGGSTSTTTTTTGVNANNGLTCQCVYPSYCGTEDGECTWTDCTQGTIERKDCTGTTTTTPDLSSCDCSTTTTQDLGVGCSIGCTWYYLPARGWIKQSDGCDSSCPCPPPPENAATAGDCVQYTTACNPPVPTTPEPKFCIGDCRYYCNLDDEWVYSYSDCESQNVDRWKCARPTRNCSCGEIAWVACASMEPTTTTTTTTTKDECLVYCETGTSTTQETTTTDELSCDDGHCIYASNGSLEWELQTDNCGACDCAAPIEDPQETCETIQVGCGGTTTTSTTTTTTTTTNCCEGLSDTEDGSWCGETITFEKVRDYQWSYTGTLPCGDFFSATFTCDPENPDAGPPAGDCDTRYDVSIHWPCATSFTYNIFSCDCEDAPVISWSADTSGCNCTCTSPTTTTSTTTTTTTTTAVSTTSTTTTTTTTVTS